MFIRNFLQMFVLTQYWTQILYLYAVLFRGGDLEKVFKNYCFDTASLPYKKQL